MKRIYINYYKQYSLCRCFHNICFESTKRSSKAEEIEGIHLNMQWSEDKKDEPYRPGDVLALK